MKNILIIYLFLFSQFVFSQNKLSTEQRAATLSAIITNCYTKNYSESKTSEKENYKKLIEEYDKILPEYTIKEYCDALDRSFWKNTRQNLTEKVYRQIIIFIENKEISSIDDLEGKLLNDCELNEQIKPFISFESCNDLKDFYKDSINDIGTVDNFENEGAKNPLITKINNVERSSFFDFDFNILHVFFILIICFFIYLLVSRKQKERIKTVTSATTNPNNFNDGFRIKEECSYCSSKDSKIRELKNEIDKLKSDLIQKNNTSSESNEVINEEKHKVIHHPLSVEKIILYLPSPSKSGTFRKEGASISKKTNISMYRFEMDSKDSLTAKVYFDPEEQMAFIGALNSPDSSILPVCFEENGFNQQAKRIITVKPGTARLNGDQWQVRDEDKLIIRYE